MRAFIAVISASGIYIIHRERRLARVPVTPSPVTPNPVRP
jgi:hypothetical protein